MVFHQIRAGRSREYRDIGDRDRLRDRTPRNGAEIAGDFAWRQLPDADRQHTPWVSACDRGVRGRIPLPVIADQNELHIRKISHQLFGILEFVLHSGRNERFRARIEVAQ